MDHATQFYIGGEWVEPLAPHPLEVIDPATEAAFATIALGGAADVDRAVIAARAAFHSFSRTTRAQRLDLLRAILAAYRPRAEELAQVLTQEMGTPIGFARSTQVATGELHLEQMIRTLQDFAFTEARGRTLIVREAIGVCGLITPWNWPINQIVCKVAPALAAGCTMVLKPSEVAPLSAVVWTEILHAAGVPPGVFNLVQGDGPTVGEAMSSHPDIDFMSFTGSTRAGIQVARAAAGTVKRVAQELGGKSPFIVLDDADLPRAVTSCVVGCFDNNGQSCDAPTRLLVPAAMHARALNLARDVAEGFVVGAPSDPATTLGPVVSAVQYGKIQALIDGAVAEGATLVTGGPGRPGRLNRGYYIRPTIFGAVTRAMTIAHDEVFGPVLAVMPYASEAEAIEIANDSPYGLAAYVHSGSLERARAVGAELRAGGVFLNDPGWDLTAPFGGYKQSGNGREYGAWGLHEFLETKAVMGYEAG